MSSMAVVLNLVLIGGFTSDHTIWNGMLDELASKYRVLIFDNPGAGLSYIAGSSYTVRQHANDIQKFLKYLNINSDQFLGHSMGGNH